MSIRTVALVAFLLSGLTAAGVAAESRMDQALQQVTVGKEANPALPDAAGDVAMSDPATRAQYLAAMRHFYEYRASGYAYRSRVFEWQLLSSRLIFLVVLLLVGAGIYFAAVQFHVAMLAARRDLVRTEGAAAGANPLATHVEISEKGVVVNSSVLGVIITGLSLAFFYLYLVYVYPIQNVF